MLGQRFAFGSFVLNPETGILVRGGEVLPIGQRAASLLGRLLESPGEVIAKAELIDAAWPDTAVEESNLSVQIASLRKILGETPVGGEWIATVSRVGYRFVGDVRIHNEADPSPRLDRAMASAAEPSIAVLPFANLSEDPEQEYFGEGLADDIITGLSRLRWLQVIARNSSFTYGAKNIDVRQVGRELGAGYILEGSVRQSGRQLRVNAQLSDTSTGLQIWA